MKKIIAITAAIVLTAWVVSSLNHAKQTDTERMASVMSAASGTQP